MLTYDLQRYHPDFAIAIVDQVLEDARRGLEQNMYSTNQRRVTTIKYLGELYIYRLLSSGIVFDTLWSMVTFGHRELYLHVQLLGFDRSEQLMGGRSPSKFVLLICPTTSSVCDLFACFSIHVECVSIVEPRRRNWTTS